MAINIKDEDVHQQVKQIAGITGETQAEAVRVAVAERLSRLRRTDRKRRLLQISRESAALIPAGAVLDDRDLYDDRGLPR